MNKIIGKCPECGKSITEILFIQHHSTVGTGKCTINKQGDFQCEVRKYVNEGDGFFCPECDFEFENREEAEKALKGEIR